MLVLHSAWFWSIVVLILVNILGFYIVHQTRLEYFYCGKLTRIDIPGHTWFCVFWWVWLPIHITAKFFELIVSCCDGRTSLDEEARKIVADVENQQLNKEESNLPVVSGD